MNGIKIVNLAVLLSVGLVACTVGPDYVKPKVPLTPAFKEAPPGWKLATPRRCAQDAWWEVFADPLLNTLEQELTLANQDIKSAVATYAQARALVDQAKAAYWPIVTPSLAIVRQKNASSGNNDSNSNSVSSVLTPNVGADSAASSISRAPFTDYNLSLDAAWMPDIWGSVKRSVEAARANSQANEAALAAVKLLAQAQLAQYYFQLRGLDVDQIILNQTVDNYQKLLQITINQYHAGIVSQATVLQAKSALELAQVQAVDNGITRAQYEHAIAVLLAKPPAVFALTPVRYDFCVPNIPGTVPSILLERRPDIAQYERLVAQANAQIGVAIAAFFPVLSISAAGGFNTTNFTNLFTKPAQFWSIGAQLADTLLDGGLRSAQVTAARAAYEQTVAQYRKTVLTAFQEVEDNLVSLTVLANEQKIQQQAVMTAKEALKLVLNQYQAGTLGFADVLNSENAHYTAQKAENDIMVRQVVAAVSLIKALGGGWDLTDNN